MNLWTRRAARCVGILALSAGVAFAASSPASAASPNFAIGVSLVGVIPGDPLVVSTFPGVSPNESSGINLVDTPGWVTGQPIPISGIPDVLTTGHIATVAGPVSAGSTVSNVALTVTPVVHLTATTLSSSCSYDVNSGRVFATSQHLGAVINGLNIPIPAVTAPNTIIAIPGLATVTLNRQRTAPDGTLTVDALTVNVFGSAQNIALGTSSCNKASLT